MLGYQARFDRDDEECPLRIELPKNEGKLGVSGHLLTRIGMEFVSPEWIALSSIESFIAISSAKQLSKTEESASELCAIQ